MDKTIRKLKLTGKIFRVLFTVAIVSGIVFCVLLFAAGAGLALLSDGALPEEYGRGLSEFLASDEDEAEKAADGGAFSETQLKEMLADIIDNIGSGSIIWADRTVGRDSDLSVRELMAICAFAMSFFVFMLTIYFSVLKSLIKTLSSGEKPFTIKAAKKLRWLSLFMLLLIFFQPLSSVILFAVTLVFSLLFEYGAYLQDKADETARIQEEMIMSFAEITENKSEQTGKHVRRVAEYSRIIAEGMGFDSERAANIRLASTMHDIGKLMIPAEILEKPARLTDEEFATIKLHPGYGGRLLDNVEGSVMELARTIALEHHERPDGKGYPAGKSGSELMLESRIVAVADVYDALTSKRSYKEPWEHTKAYEEILKGRGTQFDAQVVDAFAANYGRINEMRQKYADES